MGRTWTHTHFVRVVLARRQERIEGASRLFRRLERSARAAWGRARTYVNARRVRMVPGRGCCVLIRLVRLSRHRVRVMILARTSTWPTVVHRLRRWAR